MAFNPWSVSDTPDDASPQYAVPETNRYAVPSPGSAYVTSPSGSWAPALRTEPGNTPDPGRLGTEPLQQRYPVPNRPPEEWYGRNAAELAHRHTAEHIDGNGWPEDRSGGTLALGTPNGTRFARNPREIPPTPERVTDQMSPSRYAFWRGMGVGSPKLSGQLRLNGVHFSMADHRRNYPILGTQPARKPGAGTRNTYRLPPVPWDANMVDMPPSTARGLPQAQIEAPPVSTPYANRSGRLY